MFNELFSRLHVTNYLGSIGEGPKLNARGRRIYEYLRRRRFRGADARPQPAPQFAAR